MRLAVESRYVGNAAVCRCRGRIVCGAEARLVEERVRGNLCEVRDIVLHLGEVEWIDSAGLGVLVRLLATARSAGGDLKLAAAPDSVRKLLNVTNLARVFEVHASEEEALAALSCRRTAGSSGSGPRVVCLDASCDVLAFLRTLLAGAGYEPITTDNLPDAKVLLTAKRPALVMVGTSIDAMRTSEVLQRAAPGVAVLYLPAGFETHDAAEAGTAVLNLVRAAITAMRDRCA